MDLKELSRVDPETHWYYQAKLEAVLKAASGFAESPQSLIEVGAGSGFFARSVAQALGIARVTCVDTNYESDWQENEGSYTFTRRVPAEGADLYLFIDVLEHVPDDSALIREYVDQAPIGAVFIFTVPAFMSMWSSHDVYLDHFRRYRLDQLKSAVADAGLRVLEAGYLFGSIFPAAWLMRRLRRNSSVDSDMKPLPSTVNSVLKAGISLEHRHVRNSIAGVSALAVARKTG